MRVPNPKPARMGRRDLLQWAGAGTVDPAQCASWKNSQRSKGWNVIGQQTLLGTRSFKAGAVQSLWNDGWDGHMKADYAKIAARLAGNSHFVAADGERKGYGVVNITPQQLTTTLRVVDDVTRKDTRIETLAQFTVQAGKPSVQRVA